MTGFEVTAGINLDVEITVGKSGAEETIARDRTCKAAVWLVIPIFEHFKRVSGGIKK